MTLNGRNALLRRKIVIQRRHKRIKKHTFTIYKAARLAIASGQHNKRKYSTKHKKESQNKATIRLYVRAVIWNTDAHDCPPFQQSSCYFPYVVFFSLSFSFILVVYMVCKVFWFLQRVSIACYAECCIIHSKSVCPSVTHWHWVKTTQATIMGSSLEDSHMTLLSSTLNCTAEFQREHGERSRAPNERGVGKIGNF